jgi:hypothetical protein
MGHMSNVFITHVPHNAPHTEKGLLPFFGMWDKSFSTRNLQQIVVGLQPCLRAHLRQWVNYLVASKVILLIIMIFFSFFSSSSFSSPEKTPPNRRLGSKQFETIMTALCRQVLPVLQVGHWDTINEPHIAAESL